MITTSILGPIQNSRILDVRLVQGDVTDESNEIPPLIAGLLTLGPTLRKDYPGKQLLLMANIDSNIWDIMKYENELREFYTFSFPKLSTISTTNSKIEFPPLAREFGLNVPETRHCDLDDGVASILRKFDQWDDYPWIVKPVMGYGYERLSWPGKKKIYTVTSPSEFKTVISMLEEQTAQHPKARRFVVQPRVEGNDTHNLLITAYVDTRGNVTMIGSAQVIMEDHSPSALGNPAVMITEPYPKLYRQVQTFLQAIGWRGFANFDLKVDSRTGTPYFFELNPRIGRSLYYNTAAGLNPMRFLVDDLIYGKSVPLETIENRILYSYLPKNLVLRYVDEKMAKKIRYLYRKGRVFHPLFNAAERDLSVRAAKREAYARLSTQKHWLKFHRNFPVEEFRKLGTESLDTAPLRK
ncbi:MAG: carboxylate--amine ligase [Actinomycetaceae bacterium]|nr:carboxylate--amine ligase [Actinomycetaceae bacterium]